MRAPRLRMRGDRYVAAAIAVWTVSRPPVDTFHTYSVGDDVFVLKWSTRRAQTGEGRRARAAPEAVLKKTKRNAAIINDLAFFMRRADPSTARELLQQVVASYPDRTAAQLNLADLLHAAGATVAAGKHYRVYLAQMRKKGLERKVPARVLERIGAPGKLKPG